MSIKIDSIWEAIAKRFQDTDLRNMTGLDNGLFHFDFPQDRREDFPYVVWRTVGVGFDGQLKGGEPNVGEVADVTMQFLIFDDRSRTNRIDDLVNRIDELYGVNSDNLVVDDYTHIISIREGMTVTHVNNVWQYTITYGMQFEREWVVMP